MKITAISTLLLFSHLAFAETKTLEEFYLFFKKGQYQNAIKALDKMDLEQSNVGSKYYLTGLSYARLQEFDKAVFMFQKAIENKSDSKDLNYEYGQALYAINSLKNSREQFKKSADLNYNKSASLYYVGHISQILEDYTEAQRAYTEIIRDKSSDTKIEQVARFQLAESLLSVLRNTETNKSKIEDEINKRIIPMLKLALEVDKASTVSLDIQKRIHEIMKEFNLDPDVMINGRRIASKRLNSYFDIKTKFDDNVTNTNLENDVTQSHKESYIIETEADTKYDFSFKKRYIISPELRVNYNQYSNQDESLVYQNDSMILAGVLKNKIEHIVKNSPASFIFDIDYSKTFKDYLKVHSREAYSSATTFTFGEQCSFTPRGDTTFKFKYKNFSAYTETLNNHTTSLSVDQTLSIANTQLLIILFETDRVNNYNSTSTSTNSYLLRFDYIFPDFIPQYTVTASLASTLTDTLEAKTTRGFETTINPSIEISKDITEKIKGILSVDYTKNISKSTDYTYQKYVTNLELKYSF